MPKLLVLICAVQQGRKCLQGFGEKTSGGLFRALKWIFTFDKL
jgi:hypothetical protein